MFGYGRKEELPDQRQFFPLIKRMYENSDTEEISKYCMAVQQRAFKNEIDTLKKFGIKKRIKITEKEGAEELPTSREFTDGKVKTLLSVTLADTVEDYYNSQGDNIHHQAIRNSFIKSYMIKMGRKIKENSDPPLCMNCGAPLEKQGDILICSHCKVRYKTEAYDYLLSHIEFESAFRGFGKFWIFLIIIFVFALLYYLGFLGFLEASVNELNSLSPDELPSNPLYLALVILVGSVVILGIFFLAKSIIQHYVALKEVRQGDPDFSLGVFQLRIMDMLKGKPELLRKSDEEEIICRNLQDLILVGHNVERGREELDFICKIGGLKLTEGRSYPKIKDVLIKKRFKAVRKFGLKTPVYYGADLYTCPSCGGHSFIENEDSQICDYCGKEVPMKEVDWIIE